MIAPNTMSSPTNPVIGLSSAILISVTEIIGSLTVIVSSLVTPSSLDFTGAFTVPAFTPWIPIEPSVCTITVAILLSLEVATIVLSSAFSGRIFVTLTLASLPTSTVISVLSKSKDDTLIGSAGCSGSVGSSSELEPSSPVSSSPSTGSSSSSGASAGTKANKSALDALYGYAIP